MKNVEISEKAGAQFNRVSLDQLRDLGLSRKAIRGRVAAGLLTRVHRDVFAVPPLDPKDEWGRWMAAVLTQPGSVLSHASAAAAWGFWSPTRSVETISRPGSGGPRRLDGLLVYRSLTLDSETTSLRGVAITSAPRTILDIAAHVSERALARSVRDAVRLRRTTLHALADVSGRNRTRRGASALTTAIARYAGLPIERARSGAEVRALEILRDAGRPLPELNVRRAGEEADLSWPALRLIIEIDGGPFHLDAGEDARKQAVWEAAGWRVLRLDADLVYADPERLLALAPTDVVPQVPQ